MAVVKRWLAFLAALLALLAALIFAAVDRPEWFLTPPRARWAVRTFGAAWRPRWKSLELRLRSDSLSEKWIDLQAEDLCLEAARPAFQGCLSRLDLSARLRLSRRRPWVRLERLERAVVHAGAWRLELPRPAAKRPASRKSGPWSLPAVVPAFAQGISVGTIDVDLASLDLRQGARRGRGSLRLRYPTRDRTLAASGDWTTGARRWAGRARISSDFFQGGRLTFLDGGGRLSGPAGAGADFAARLAQAGPRRLSLRADLAGRWKARRLRLDVSGQGGPSGCDLRGGFAVRDDSGPVRSADLRDCRLRLSLDERAGSARIADLNCGLAIVPAPLPLSVGRAAPAANGDLSFHADMRDGVFAARLRSDLSPQGDWRTLSLRASAEASGRSDGLPQSLRGSARVDLSVSRFEDLVSLLKGTAYAVPAPLNVMKGPLALSLAAAAPAGGLPRNLDYRLSADLAGAGQKLSLSAEGTASTREGVDGARVFEDTTTVDLREAAFDLPYLKIGPVPKMFVDPRIKTGRPGPAPAPPAAPAGVARKAATRLRYSARVFTSRPILLRSNLALSPIPVSLDVRASSGALEGTIGIGRFEAKLFRQTAVIDHVTLTPSASGAEAGLDGLVLYKRPDATIYIHLLGTTAKPQVSLSSDPPMTRDEITALLLYGEPPDALDEDQRANVGNASNGMASGAFGLTSLYLFAATPIEYVGYDPTTQTYAVRLKIPGGLHMELGSSSLQESRYLTLRKRLAAHWQVETQAASRQDQGNAITTFLEWFERY